MMESELKSHDNLLQQLKKLRSENELLEKHVFVLNELLSTNELKEKISILEKKKEKLNQFENIVGRLRAEIEPLNYLKSVLENKLVNENITNTIKPQVCIDLKPIYMDHVECKIPQLQNQKNIPIDSTNTDLVSSQMSCDDLLTTNYCSNSISAVNEGSLDDCVQLLDQYDVVTEQEISNFPVEGNVELSVNNSANDTTNSNKCTIQDHEASTSQLLKSQFHKKICSDIKDNLGLCQMPQVLLEQGINCVNIEEELECLKMTNADINCIDTLLEQHKISDKGDNFRTIGEKETTSTSESTGQAEQMENIKIPNSDNSKTNINSFNDMNLKIDILRGIYSLGFSNPTALQKQVVVNCLNGRDVIVFARPGNGRSMMFAIPLLQRIKTNLKECQALVLVPTRDLAVHIQKIIMSVGDFLGVNVCIGGDNVPKKLTVIPHVVVGTPEGVFNMIACKSLHTRCIQTVVINKIEKMLNNDCTKLIEKVMKKLEKNKQVTLLASEKLDHVLDIYMDSLIDPLVIISDDDIKEENDVIKCLPNQFYLTIEEDWKLNAFCEINETLKMKGVIIFCNTLDRAQKLFDSLIRLDYSVARFHLEMSASQRELVLNMFSTKRLHMLITTDPIKGGQFEHAAWIINYDLPSNPICYINRIGKCTKQTKVLNLINQNEDDTKLIIETYNKSSMIQTPLNSLDLLLFMNQY